jgi:hypothetical protein
LWWKLAGLGAIEAAVIVVLFLPLQTHAVRYDVPPPTSVVVWGAVQLLALVVVLLVAVITPLWLAHRVIRKHRNGVNASKVDASS